jgi:predicted DNA-binding transcriptional regulator YafY
MTGDKGKVRIDYTNWLGRRGVREIVPLSLKFGSNEWHPNEQWMLLAHDIAKGEDRWFAMAGIHSWETV